MPGITSDASNHTRRHRTHTIAATMSDASNNPGCEQLCEILALTNDSAITSDHSNNARCEQRLPATMNDVNYIRSQQSRAIAVTMCDASNPISRFNHAFITAIE